MHRHARIASFIVGAWVAAPQVASAQCTYESNCYCTAALSPVLVDGTIQSASASVVVVSVDTVLSAPDGGATLPATFSLSPNTNEATSGEVLVSARPLVDGGWEPGAHLDVASDGSIDCAFSNPDQRFPKATVVNALLQGEQGCYQAMMDAGFVEPPCNDVGSGWGCSSTGEAGVVCGVLTLALWGARRRKHPRPARVST